MTDAVHITTTARLHLGFLDLTRDPIRRFGSIGLALDGPETRLTLRRAQARRVRGPEAERAERYLATLEAGLGLAGSHDLVIATTIPAHAGLGSGTQLALAIATALRALHRLPPDPRGDAARLGRGLRSGIGIALFEQGGLAVDGGRGAHDAPPPLVARLAVPESWRVIVVLDPAVAGLSGAPERAAFTDLPPMAESIADTLCRLVLMQALPALAEDDLAGFGAALTRVQKILGDYFAPAQGGRFTSVRVARALAMLAEAGAVGIGQSSWGPSGFAFVRADAEAARLVAGLRRTGEFAAESDLDIRICRVLNHGARVERTE
jgi:beta-RFAP synthase